MATDPVCGMTVEEGPEALRFVRDNRTYYFCSEGCVRSFAAPEEARRRLLRRLGVAWPLSVAVVFLTFVPAVPEGRFAAAGLAAVVQFYVGQEFYRGAADAVRARLGNMDLLIAVGSTAAFLYSVAVLAAPGRLPPATFFDASALIVTVILTGNYLELFARRQAGSALARLAELLPTTAVLTGDGPDRAVGLGTLRVGQAVRVAPGEPVPVDGTVRSGRSAVDEALLTGEGRLVAKAPGAKVLAGSRNLEGPLVVEVSAVGADTFVAHVGALLEDAERARVPLQRRADRLAQRFVPFVLGLGAAAGILWGAVLGGGLTLGLLVFVTVAVTGCPCAFGLATPAAILVGTGRAAEEGILFRGGDTIERAATVDTVLLDKTGTLTTAAPEVESVVAVPPATDEEALAIAAGLEVGIHHPLAAAVERAAVARGVPPVRYAELRLDPGRGVEGTAEGRRDAIVRDAAAAEAGLAEEPLAGWVRRAEAAGAAWSVVLRDGRPVGAISFRAPLAPGAREAVASLRADRVRVAMVTGDREAAAGSVAAAVGIEEVHAGATPEEKVGWVRQYRRQGHRVAFVGDGINDAAALAAADLGIALGTGSDVAREAGQVLLVRHDLEGVPRALRAARRIVGRVRGNLAWAIGYNAVLLPVAAGALVPALGPSAYGYLPVLGAVAMGLSSTTVLVSSLSLRWAIGPPRRGRRPTPVPPAGRPAAEAV